MMFCFLNTELRAGCPCVTNLNKPLEGSVFDSLVYRTTNKQCVHTCDDSIQCICASQFEEKGSDGTMQICLAIWDASLPKKLQMLEMIEAYFSMIISMPIPQSVLDFDVIHL